MFVGRFTENGNGLDNALKNLLTKQKLLNVGFLEGRMYPDTHIKTEKNTQKEELPVAQVAFWNEYGTENMPARPFMRMTAEKHMQEWADAVKEHMRTTGLDLEAAMTAVGARAVADLQETIESNVPPPNAASTVRAKQKKGLAAPDHTLVDSGTMQTSIDFEIVDG